MLFRLNYTALRIALDNWINSTQFNERTGRFLGSRLKLPKFLSGLSSIMDLEQVIKEIETSIMTTVSCNFCLGGEN